MPVSESGGIDIDACGIDVDAGAALCDFCARPWLYKGEHRNVKRLFNVFVNDIPLRQGA